MCCQILILYANLHEPNNFGYPQIINLYIVTAIICGYGLGEAGMLMIEMEVNSSNCRALQSTNAVQTIVSKDKAKLKMY